MARKALTKRVNRAVNDKNILCILKHALVSQRIKDKQYGGHAMQRIHAILQHNFVYRPLLLSEKDHIKSIMVDLYNAGRIKMTNYSGPVNFKKRFGIVKQKPSDIDSSDSDSSSSSGSGSSTDSDSGSSSDTGSSTDSDETSGSGSFCIYNLLRYIITAVSAKIWIN